MARLESQSIHQRDNAKRLNEIDSNVYYQTLVHNMVTEIINQITKMVLEQAAILERSTSINDGNIIRLPHGRQLMNLNSNTGLCHHVGRVLLTAELKRALDNELASAAAYAIKQGDSKNSVAKAMRKNPSNLYTKPNGIGNDIKKLLAAYTAIAEHPSDHRYDEVDVQLHDGYVYTIERQD